MVAVLEADFAEGDRLTSLFAIAYPQQHGVAIEVLRAMTSDVGQVDAGGGKCLTPATEVADCGVIVGSIATAVYFGP